MTLLKCLAISTMVGMISCSSIPKRTDIKIPILEDLRAVSCEIRPYDGDRKRKYDVYFTAWHTAPILDVPKGQERHVEPDWEYWYSRRGSRWDAQKDCILFYVEAEKKYIEYQKSINKKR